MNLNTYIFISRSGGGKGTQAKLLREYLTKNDPDTPVLYLYTGEDFRKFIKREEYVPRLSNTVYVAGGRQPDFLAVHMWAHRLIEDFTGKEHLMFDGTPRSLNEARILDTVLPFLNIKKTYPIFINVSREWSRERLLGRGRSDDSEEEIKKRLDYFDKDVEPAIDYYRSHSEHHFCEVNGEQAIEKVHDEIISGISK